MVRDVDILTAGTRTDVYGDSQPDWTTPTTVTVKGWLAWSSSIEVLDGRDATSSTLTLTVPAGTPITARDRVSIDGRIYEINGEPMPAWTPRGEHHIEMFLTTAVG
jgi:head-tail adaptor